MDNLISVIIFSNNIKLIKLLDIKGVKCQQIVIRMEMIKPILLLFMIISFLILHHYAHNAPANKILKLWWKKNEELMSCKIL